VFDPLVVIEDPVLVVDDDARRPDPEVPQRARRRTFTAKYKLGVLAAYDAASDGEKGAVLRREGLYSSHLVDWRRARDVGALAGLTKPRGRPARGSRETTTGKGVGQGPLRGRCPSKTTRALGDHLRGRGHRAEVDAVTTAAITTLSEKVGIRAACVAVGVAQAGYYRRNRVSPAPVRPVPVAHRDRTSPAR